MKSGYYLDTNRHLVGYLAEEEVTNTALDQPKCKGVMTHSGAICFLFE